MKITGTHIGFSEGRVPKRNEKEMNISHISLITFLYSEATKLRTHMIIDKKFILKEIKPSKFLRI